MRIISLALFIGFLVNFCSSCKKKELCKDENLKLKKESFNPQEFKINGYYVADVEDNNLVEVFVFYSNGFFLNPGSISEENLDSNLKIFSTTKYNDRKYGWGLYQVNSNKIVIEHWLPEKCGHPISRLEGQIQNDSTLTFHKEEIIKGENRESFIFNVNYFFKKIKGKPDSTNQFID